MIEMSKNEEMSTSNLLPKMPTMLHTQGGTEARSACREKDRFNEAEAMSTKTLESKKSDLAFLNEKITAFQNDLASSTTGIDTATGDDDLFHRLAVDARKYEREIASMTCRRNELIGKIRDTRVFEDVLADVQTEDWDWGHLVVDNIELPAEATVGFESSRAEDFRARVMNAHGQDESDHAWCFITGRKLFGVTTAAHIIDRNVGDIILNVIYGELETDFGHVDSSGNG